MTEGDRENWRSAPIEDLQLSMRAYSCLKRSGLITLGRIVETSEEQLLSLRNFGRKSYDELREKLDELGVIAVDADWDSARGVN